jgi:2-polyprenyl-3-methyl-5-hydroxy-6-metoxy-1,4-benzoquinol methylase
MLDYSKILHHKYDALWRRLVSQNYSFAKNNSHYTSKFAYKEVIEFKNYVSRGSKKLKTVLDIGTGNARHAIVFAQDNFHVYANDISQHAIEFSKYHSALCGAKISFLCSDILETTYDNNFFDIVLDCGCFHHLRQSQWKKYLSIIKNIIIKDGYMFLLVFSDKTGVINKFGKKQGKYHNWSINNHHYYHYFSKEDIGKIFANDFKVLKCYDIRKDDSQIYFKIVYMQKK